jgi:predicted ATP-grasp superfamily ATP-dependent carboligase
MIEYKVDALTGIHYLMEINGRFWGSLQLAIDAGVDFPRLLAACALGEPVAEPPSYRHVRSRWWWGEVDHVVTRLRRPARDLHLATDTPSLARSLCDFLASPLRPRDREEVFRPGDPHPFFRETEQWFRQL